MDVKRLSGWLLVAAIAATLAGCGASADPSPPEPTQKQGQELLPVGGGGPSGPGTGSGGNTCYGGADPDNPKTWYCLPQSECPVYCAPGFYPACSSVTDYAWVCTNDSPGGCTHGCAPL